MSDNIHGFGRNNNNNNNNNQNRGGNDGGFRPVQMINPDEGDNGLDPRKESFGHFIKNTCCPSFKVLSVIFFVSLIDLVIYIITLCFGIKQTATELLAPTYETLDKFGMKDPSKIKRGEVHRLILFAILHANLVHLFVNLFSQIIIGSFIEKSIGSLKAGLLYLLSSIGGGIFSCLVSDAPGVGASVAIFGMLGAYFGFMLMNWNYLDRVMGTTNKFCNLIFMSFIVIMNVSYGFANPIIDNYGHIGGLLFGFFLVFVICQPVENDDGVCCKYKIWMIISIVVLAIGYIGGLIIFYTVRKV